MMMMLCRWCYFRAVVPVREDGKAGVLRMDEAGFFSLFLLLYVSRGAASRTEQKAASGHHLGLWLGLAYPVFVWSGLLWLFRVETVGAFDTNSCWRFYTCVLFCLVLVLGAV